MIKMPIKVLYASISVEAESPAMASGLNHYGAFKPLEHKIVIRSDLAPAGQAATLVHELLHAVFHAHGINAKALDEEGMCRALEGPLTALFTDNPWLAGVLHQAVTHGQPIVKPTLH